MSFFTVVKLNINGVLEEILRNYHNCKRRINVTTASSYTFILINFHVIIMLNLRFRYTVLDIY